FGNDSLTITKQLPGLKEFSLYQTAVSDLSNLLGSKIQSLSLQGNASLQYIWNLASLSTLSTITLETNLNYMNSLSSLTQVTSLTLWYNNPNYYPISWFTSAVAGMTQLHALSMSYFGYMSDVSFLQNLVNLQELNLDSNNIYDLTP